MARSRGRRRKKNNFKRINKVCAEISAQFTHRDVVPYEDMYSLIVTKYGGEPPSIPNVLRLCVRHDRTSPPILRDGETFSSFVEKIQRTQSANTAELFAKWRVRIDGRIQEFNKVSDLSKKN